MKHFGRLLSASLVLFCAVVAHVDSPRPLHAWDEEISRKDSPRVQAAIQRACTALMNRLKSETDAYAALEAMALIKSGYYNGQRPEIQEVCTRICSRVNSQNFADGGHFIYEAGVSIMCLANTDSRKYKPQIEVIAKFIIANQGSNGQWGYKNAQEGDTSISQYAVLGLWEASRAGVEIPLEVWDKAAQWHLRYQQKDGGFAYHPDAQAPGGGIQSTHSMTAAAVGSLQIARRFLYPGAREIASQDQTTKRKVNKSGKKFGILTPVFRTEVAGTTEAEKIAVANSGYVRKVRLAQLDEGLKKGLDWLTERFTVTKPTGHHIYYLYALERAATLSNLVQFDTHDWYEEGSEYLIANQTSDGCWNDSSGTGPAAAFGVLFLSRATSRMLNRSPRVEFGAGILIGGRGLPDDLKATQVNEGKVKGQEKSKTPLEDLLSRLETPGAVLQETEQTQIIEQVVIGDKNKLIGQIDRLRKLAVHPDPEVRRTAMWALGRSGDLRQAPLLIKGLEDNDVDVYVEARNGLRCLGRKVEDFKPTEDPLDANSRKSELAHWKAWYRQIREYSERDDQITNPDS